MVRYKIIFECMISVHTLFFIYKTLQYVVLFR
nr:MAG TPA: hypothetical protein [Caudoviricetes sp.]